MVDFGGAGNLEGQILRGRNAKFKVSCSAAMREKSLHFSCAQKYLEYLEISATSPKMIYFNKNTLIYSEGWIN